jgi:formylglycine-generating enzyme required for sulfatase activity
MKRRSQEHGQLPYGCNTGRNSFMMGSPDDEPFRRTDEGPAREVEVDSFYMAEIEVTWDEYLAFYSNDVG